MTTMGQHQSCCGSCARQPISESRANLRAGPISERLHGRGSPCAAPCGSRFKPIIRRSERQPTSHTPRESLTRLDTSHNRVTHIAVSDSHSGLGRGAGAEATALYSVHVATQRALRSIRFISENIRSRRTRRRTVFFSCSENQNLSGPSRISHTSLRRRAATLGAASAIDRWRRAPDRSRVDEATSERNGA